MHMHVYRWMCKPMLQQHCSLQQHNPLSMHTTMYNHIAAEHSKYGSSFHVEERCESIVVIPI